MADLIALPAVASRLDELLAELATTQEPREIMRIADTAEAMRMYARRAHYGLMAQNLCAKIRVHAERRLGEYLGPIRSGRPRSRIAQGPDGTPKMVASGDHFPTLGELGITKRLSARAQRLAAIPQPVFDDHIARVIERGDELTARRLLLHAEFTKQAELNRRKIVGGKVDDLLAWAKSNKAGTILLDPAWPIPGGRSIPYETISPDDLARLPIRELANPTRCHLFLWCLPNWSLWDAKAIIEAWSFRPIGVFAWCKTGNIGCGNYWRHDVEFLIAAVNTLSDRFDDHSFGSFRVAPREGHSRKPDWSYEIIEVTSPSPRLELFARKVRPGWWGWGHEILGGVAGDAAE